MITALQVYARVLVSSAPWRGADHHASRYTAHYQKLCGAAASQQTDEAKAIEHLTAAGFRTRVPPFRPIDNRRARAHWRWNCNAEDSRPRDYPLAAAGEVWY